MSKEFCSNRSTKLAQGVDVFDPLGVRGQKSVYHEKVRTLTWVNFIMNGCQFAGTQSQSMLLF